MPTFILAVALPYVNRSSEFGYCWKVYEICYKTRRVLFVAHAIYGSAHALLRTVAQKVRKCPLYSTRVKFMRTAACGTARCGVNAARDVTVCLRPCTYDSNRRRPIIHDKRRHLASSAVRATVTFHLIFSQLSGLRRPKVKSKCSLW